MTWIVVADSTRARILSRETPRSSLTELDDLTHPGSRLQGGDIEADRPGRTFDSAGAGRHAMAPDTETHRREAQVFAREVARYLDEHRTHQAYQDLVLVAPPAFLGLLREALSRETAAHVRTTLDKALVTLETGEIAARLAAL